MQNMNLHYMENARHEIALHGKCTTWKMIELTTPGKWQKSTPRKCTTWKMHNTENDRKYTHWKMIEITHTGK